MNKYSTFLLQINNLPLEWAIFGMPGIVVNLFWRWALVLSIYTLGTPWRRTVSFSSASDVPWVTLLMSGTSGEQGDTLCKLACWPKTATQLNSTARAACRPSPNPVGPGSPRSEDFLCFVANLRVNVRAEGTVCLSGFVWYFWGRVRVGWVKQARRD